MKVRAKIPFYDDTGLHKSGEIVEIKNYDPAIMEKLEEKPAETKTKKK